MIRVVSTKPLMGLLAGLAVSSLAGCQKPAAQTGPDADATAIRAVEDAMRDAYKAKDAARLIAAYAPDATLYVASERPRVGTEAVSQSLKQELEDPAFNLVFTTGKVAVAASATWAIRRAASPCATPTLDRVLVSYSGYYLTVFKKQPDGSWKAVEDMALPAS